MSTIAIPIRAIRLSLVEFDFALAVKTFIFVVCVIVSVPKSALAYTPNDFYRGVENILILPIVAVNGVPVYDPKGIPGVTGAEEVSNSAVSIIREGISSGEKGVEVHGVRRNDSRLAAASSLTVMVIISVQRTPLAGVGYQPDSLVLHVRVRRHVLPPGSFEPLWRTFPVAIDIPEDSEVFKENLNMALSNLLQKTVIKYFRQ